MNEHYKICVNNTVVKSLTSKYLVFMEKMKKHCWGQFLLTFLYFCKISHQQNMSIIRTAVT